MKGWDGTALLGVAGWSAEALVVCTAVGLTAAEVLHGVCPKVSF